MATVLTYSAAYKLVDEMCKYYRALRGDGATYGVGTASVGALSRASDLQDLIQGVSDSEFRVIDWQLALGNPARVANRHTLDTLFASIWSSFFSNLSAYCANSRSIDSSIIDLDTFLKWYNYTNGVTYWQAMTPPEWRFAHYALKGVYPDPKNVYFAAIKSGTMLDISTPHGLWQKTLPSTDDGNYIIDPTAYSGGVAYARWTGAGGAGAVSISVAGLNQIGAAETWTASGTWGAGAFTANSEIILTPGTAGAYITKVTSSPTVSGITSGVFNVESRPPAGRTWPLF